MLMVLGPGARIFGVKTMATVAANQDNEDASAHSLSDRARILLEITNAIVSQLDLTSVLKAVSRCLRREINHDFAGSPSTIPTRTNYGFTRSIFLMINHF
jgi:hypothetical protein